MSLNNVSRSLIMISKAQGYDPTKLDGKPLIGQDSMPTVSDNSAKTALGSLPGGIPDSFPEDHPQVSAEMPVDWERKADKYSMTVGPFRRRAAKPSDPFAGMGGTGL